MALTSKRVLIFSLNYYPRFIGGAEVAIKEITDRIPFEEIEFHMVTLRFDADLPAIEKIGNVLVHRIGFTKRAPSIGDLKKFPLHLNKYFYQFLAARYASQLHKQYRYDGIWAMMAHSAGIPAGLFKKRHPEVPYLLTLQEGDPPAQIERTMRPVWNLFRHAFTRADALQPISQSLLAWGRRMGFTGTSGVIPNGVDVSAFSKSFSSEEIQKMQSQLGKKERETYLITASRLVHKNGIDTVIKALTKLPATVHFAICGIGPDEAKLKALAVKYGVSERTHFLGQIEHAELPLALAACDIFIRPSRSEGMGNSFIEAMAAGLPVIATQEGGIADFLFDAVRNPGQPATGWAVDVDAPEQIANAVRDILARPEQVAQVTETARSMVRDKYDWKLVADQMRTHFHSLLS